MKSERWQKVDKLFHAALALSPEDRASFLDHACKGDQTLRNEIESLISSHDEAGSFISTPAVEANPSLVAGNDANSIIQKQIGPYVIVSKIGSGGMGEVFLARDTRLGRKVALKLLPEYFTRDHQRLTRFQQEARAASALNHPNIITIYEVGETDGRHFIAMEYIDGQTLGEKIHRDKEPLESLLKYLAQIAEGLTKAHAAGIVHRDLKPDNIMITRDGYAKVLDFGLAKLIEQPRPIGDLSSSETATALMQQQSISGMVMGTAGYMSPEQALGRAKEVDHRSDIFSFGCILYEAATGQRAFEGRDVLDSLHKIVNAPTPQIKAVSPDTPGDLDRIVRRCLTKDPEKRYQSIKEVSIELEELRHELSGGIGSRQNTRATSEAFAGDDKQSAMRSRPADADSSEARQTSSDQSLVSKIRHHPLRFAIVLIALAAIAALSVLLYRAAQNRANGIVPFQIGKVDRLTHIGKALDALISPDGKFVIYVLSDAGQESLWTRDVATNSNVQIVAPAEVHFRGMTFSPDGNYVYYVRLERNNPIASVYQVPKLGGATRKVLVDVNTPVTFSPDGKRFAFVRSSPDESLLMLANADGTGEEKLAGLKSPESFGGGGTFGSAVPGGGPAWSPDGAVVACPARILFKDAEGTSVAEVRVADGSIRPIAAKGWSSIERLEWLHDGSGLVMCAFARSIVNTQIWYVAYPGGESQMITHDLNQYGDVSLTADSTTLVSVQVEILSNIWIASPNQTATNATQLTSGRMDGYCGVSWMPDGKIVYASRKIKFADLWMMDADGANHKQLTDDQPADRFPSVTPDGRYIIFDSLGQGVLRADTDGANRKQLADKGLVPHCSPDGKWVVYQRGPQEQPSLWKVSIDGGQSVRITDKHTSRPAFSPDGKQIACFYKVERASPWKLAIFPSEGGEPLKVFQTPVSLNRFFVLRWTPDGRSILYVDESGGVGNIWSQPVDGGKPAQVTDFKSDVIYTFDLSRDGRSLAITRGTVTGDIIMMNRLAQ